MRSPCSLGSADLSQSFSLFAACIMRWQAKVVLILLFTVAMIASAQSSTQDRGLAQKTQVRGSWTDPSTGLMWAGKDNGKDVSWNKARKYCRDLRLAGYSDWRLANMVELQGVYDRTANAPGLAGPGKGRSVTWHVKGNLFLTGNQWANRNDGRGHSFESYEWYFDFNEGRSNNQPSGFPYSSSFMRTLCVHRSGE
jgi:Protein of unknown function (DUF1566)